MSLGEWLGVVWDDASRGRHDGTHEGTRYFDAGGPTAGSFVRLAKVTRPCTVSAAVRDRYGSPAEPAAAAAAAAASAATAQPLVLRDETNRAVTAVEAIGFDKVAAQQSQFHRLREVVLTNHPVGEADAPGELAALLPAVHALDLSHTLLADWAAVDAIARALAATLRTLRCESVPSGRPLGRAPPNT